MLRDSREVLAEIKRIDARIEAAESELARIEDELGKEHAVVVRCKWAVGLGLLGIALYAFNEPYVTANLFLVACIAAIIGGIIFFTEHKPRSDRALHQAVDIRQQMDQLERDKAAL